MYQMVSGVPEWANDAPWVVFRGTPAPTMIRQGGLGDCWLISAISVLASAQPEMLLNVVLTRDLSKIGAYHVRLCIDGVWRQFIVDDAFPCTQEGGLAYASGVNRQLWVPLIEKAAAKAFGSYEAIVSGQAHEGLAMLTGAPCEGMRFRGNAPDGHEEDAGGLSVQGLDHDIIWARLISYHQAQYPIGASCHPDGEAEEAAAQQMGLLSAHAYSVLDVRDTASLRLV